MSTRDEPWPQGTPSWSDLMASDRVAAWECYRALFGWQIIDSGREMGHYGLAMLDDRPIAGIGEDSSGSDGYPVAWTTYLAADDIDATTAAVRQNGGVVLMEPMDI